MTEIINNILENSKKAYKKSIMINNEELEELLFSIITDTKKLLDKVSDKKRGLGVILCLIDKKTYLRENLVALPIEFI